MAEDRLIFLVPIGLIGGIAALALAVLAKKWVLAPGRKVLRASLDLRERSH